MISKQAIDMPLACSLVGAGIVGTVAGVNKGKFDSDVALATALGGINGVVAGYRIKALGNLFRQWKMHKMLDSTKNALPSDIKKVIKVYGKLGIPVYQQTGGAPFDNAAYVEGKPKFGLLGMGFNPTFKDALTGKPVKNYADKAVYLGAKFNKLPILAHELGHAQDFKEMSGFSRGIRRAARWTTAAGAIGCLGLVIAGMADKIDPKVLGVGLASAGSTMLGGIMTSDYLSRRDERRASDRAVQVLQKVQKSRQVEQSKELLQKAYATYDPIRFDMPDFGSGEYYPQEKAARLH